MGSKLYPDDVRALISTAGTHFERNPTLNLHIIFLPQEQSQKDRILETISKLLKAIDDNGVSPSSKR